MDKKPNRNYSFHHLTVTSSDDLEQSLEVLNDINSYNPFLSSSDTDWIDNLYSKVFPLPQSARHKETFKSIVINLSLRKSAISINLSKQYYKDTDKPDFLLPTSISSICEQLEVKGYCQLIKGFKPKGKDGIPTELKPTNKLIDLIPKTPQYEIAEEGLIRTRGFTFDSIPEEVEQRREVLKRYNRTVEPENMLYSSFKDGFDVNGRFFGSAVCVMPKEDRRNIQINGESTVEVDIQNCIPFILSASELKKELPGDVYVQANVPRGIVKHALLIALNSTSKDTARQAIQHKLNGHDDYEGPTAHEILNRLEIAYPDLARYFYTGIGTKIMRIESHCMERFMCSMLDKGIKFYPIHDSVRVPASYKEIVVEELQKAFTVNGVSPTVHFE